MIERVKNQVSGLSGGLPVEPRSPGALSGNEALAPAGREAKRSPISTLFPKGDEITIGDGSRVVREAMERIKQGRPAGGFAEVPSEISALPKRLGPIMKHIVALMDGSNGDRLREIAQDAQEALSKISGASIDTDKQTAKARGPEDPNDPSPGAIQKRIRDARLEMRLQTEAKANDNQPASSPSKSEALGYDIVSA